MKKLLTLLLLTIAFNAQAWEERNLLQKAADISRLKQTLVLNQKWVPYPSYTDRAGWEKMAGVHKQEILEKGKKPWNSSGSSSKQPIILNSRKAAPAKSWKPLSELILTH